MRSSKNLTQLSSVGKAVSKSSSLLNLLFIKIIFNYATNIVKYFNNTKLSIILLQKNKVRIKLTLPKLFIMINRSVSLHSDECKG
nr:MAG TPA: hypothetical protein [Herelleviridae sp.]